MRSAARDDRGRPAKAIRRNLNSLRNLGASAAVSSKGRPERRHFAPDLAAPAHLTVEDAAPSGARISRSRPWDLLSAGTVLRCRSQAKWSELFVSLVREMR